MNERAELHRFAVKWQAVFESPAVPWRLFDDFEPLGAEMAVLGFQMDCGAAIEAAYPGVRWSGLTEWQSLLPQIADVPLLTSALFSQWRYWNHWSDAPPSGADLRWFALAFARLAELTA